MRGLQANYFILPIELIKEINRENPGISISNYKYYGLLIRPYFTHTIANNTELSIRFLPGIIRINSQPLLMKEMQWQVKMVLQLLFGLPCRFALSFFRKKFIRSDE